MCKKQYYGEVSFTGRIAFGVSEESKQKAVDKMFNDIRLQIIETTSNKSIEISEVEWELITHPQRGNIQQSLIRDFYIKEDN